MPAEVSELSRRQRIGYFLADLFLRGLIGLVLLIPYRWRVPMMGWLVAQVVAPVAGLRKRVRANLKLVQPDLSEPEIRRLCRAVPDNAGRKLIELYSPRAFAERAKGWQIGGPGLAALTEAHAAGRPVIVISGHFGNYDAARASLRHRGIEMGSIYRRMANPYFNAHYTRMMEAVGKPMFMQGRRGMIEMVRHLRAGGIIAIAADLHAHGGVEIDFFGKPAVTSTVPAELALKHNAPLIPVYGLRKPNGLDFEIIVHEPIPPTDPKTMTQAFNHDLEALVRQHMEQWFWVHRRWKPWFDLGVQPEDMPG
ncbi:lauroyl acyltransferase [Pseudooceanicola lipolyticus]|uniref:Lauroyl acyltransferase n=2 Tax=Pseudooceanicola TaxID=1679449 RepID=A0A2M8IVM0_9RHOB|nr:lysophospholipid acyltransferase family protein [Pseudooceanicola lipolyticus]PJE34571.1 lauroyl acyltransferase [Pseudooceanicola lipolyticus]